MKNKLLTKQTLISITIIIVLSAALIIAGLTYFKAVPSAATKSVAITSVSSQIQADGSVASENQATLHFQTAGKLTYLPFKEGDHVSQGKTIASLDTTILEKQITQALNIYRSTRNTFDQAQQDQSKSVLQNQQQQSTGQTDQGYLGDVAKRIVDQNQANLDNAVLNVEIAQQALQLASIASPIDGIITHMDVTTSGVNVTPTTSFTIADPNALVFRIQVAESDIDYISEGGNVDIKLGTGKKPITGTVSKIYPDKITLPSGQKVYQVDIESPELSSSTKLGENGTALIQSNSQTALKLVPTWTVLNHDSIWVIANGTPTLRHITVGKTHGDMTEVVEGLQSDDEVITNPQSIAAFKYSIL